MPDFMDEARDFTECPGDNCGADVGPYGMLYAHKHCATDGCVLMAIGGGGDDGRGIDGYEDAKGNGAEKCTDCKELVAPECVRIADGKAYCLPCWIEDGRKAQLQDLSFQNLHNAIQDVKSVIERLSKEPDANIPGLFDSALELDAVHDQLLDRLAARMHEAKAA